MTENEFPKGVITTIVDKFLTSHLAIILIIFAVSMGIGSIIGTPREEEPQIVVPIADVYVSYPGASAKEVEYLVATPLEQLLWQIDGVEYVYSTSRRDMAIVTVRFYVGEDREKSLVKLYNKINSNIDRVPSGITGWVVKPIEIDDVPVLTVTLYSPDQKYDDYHIRRVGEEVIARLEKIEDLSKSSIVGGRSREVMVELDTQLMASRGLDPLLIAGKITKEDASITAGAFDNNDRTIRVQSGPFLDSMNSLRDLVVGVYDNKPVYLSDVAEIMDVPEERTGYCRIGFGPGHPLFSQKTPGSSTQAVTLAISKKKGTNAVTVAQNVITKLDELKTTVIPSDIEIEITRNYGETANQKVNELLSSLFFAIVTVLGLLFFTMGWREALVVTCSVPITFALSLSVNYLSGYTINRVTLFALILSLGLVVDDPITNVDNIQRHIFKGKHKNSRFCTLSGVQEVLPPVIMSTLTIIVSFIPMFFITGMMGPYMGPMAINVPLTVSFSTLSALTIVPWMSYHLLKNFWGINRDIKSDENVQHQEKGIASVIYRRILSPFLKYKTFSYGFIGLMVLLLAVSAFLALSRRVPLKMLPFDNKNEFQVVIDMPEGTTLERTDAVVRNFERYFSMVNEVKDFESYVGFSSPMDFNGMVRHYYMRKGDNLADIRINLIPKDKRKSQSHEMVLRLRNDLQNIASEEGADIKIVEVPPGPPVISTIVAEIYGEPSKSYQDLINTASIVKKRMAQEDKVVDVDWTVEEPRERLEFRLDREKAALHGIDTERAVKTLRLALSGYSPATMHLPDERQPLKITLRINRKFRSSSEDLGRINLIGNEGKPVPFAEIGVFLPLPEDQPIYHKNLERVVYILGETAGRAPAEAILDMQSYFKDNTLPSGTWIEWAGEGEWDITLTVFRDLGIAFGVAFIGIYLLIVLETGSFFLPLIIMMAIPLTAIGIMPGFYILNLISNVKIGGYETPVFFTATGMIGMVALGGIVVRNSIVLIEFIKDAVKEGLPLEEAILRSGGVRFRPIMLTAITTLLGAWPITLDPIFSGLAWALIFGLFASTVFTLLLIPIVYYLIYHKK